MEAKDTVMKTAHIEEIFDDLDLDCSESLLAIKGLLEAQAEISFKAGFDKAVEWLDQTKETAYVTGKGQGITEGRKAGIREVVEWIENFDDGDTEKWNAKLKEWGL